MGRASATDAQRRAAAIHAYVDANPGVSLSQIAGQFGISKSAAHKITSGKVKAATDTSMVRWVEMQQLVQDWRRAATQELRQFGVWQAASRLVEAGYSKSEIPAEATLTRWLANTTDEAGNRVKIERVSVRSPMRRQYWSEARPTGPNQRVLIDTGTIEICGKSYTLLLGIDWYSRALHADIVPMQFARYLPWFLTRLFSATGGVPHTLQTDNGFGFIRTGYNTLSQAQVHAFSAGVKRWEYVPVAEAYRNGRVEKAVDIIKTWLVDAEYLNLESARKALAAWLHRYNTARAHSGISQRKRGGWTMPADLCNYEQPASEAPRVVSVSKRSALPDYEIVYKRFVASGCAIIPAPRALIMISPALTGHYVDVVIDSSGRGKVEFAETVTTTHNGQEIKAIVTHHIGSFATLAPIVELDHDGISVTRFRPIKTDERALLRAQMRHMKTKKPRPSWVLPGITRKDIELYDYQLIDDATGEILFDSRYATDIDHLQEFAQ